MKRFVIVGMLNFGRNLLLDFGRVYADFFNRKNLEGAYGFTHE